MASWLLSSTSMQTRTFALSLLALAGCGSGGTANPDGVPADAGPPDATTGCTTTVAPRPGTVITATGAVTGMHTGTTYAYLGIPYAAPPTGALRWQPPAPAACWTDERPATAYGPMCLQRSDDGTTVIGDEDCLTLNVWSPDGAANAPVMVFIHGGGNTGGSASDAFYDGAALAEHAGAVVVTLEYRLGALGFYASAALDAERAEHVSGNYGILDQIAALRWVQTNIAAFGGAPDQVMLFGESAGAQDTLIHVASPLSAGLFARAAAESGGAYRTSLADNETAMAMVTSTVGCAGAADELACMRAVPAADLAAIPSAEGPLAMGMRYVPSIDGYVLPDTVPNMLAAGTHNHVPLVIGTNAQETSRMVAHVSTEAEYRAAVTAQYGATAAAVLLDLYPASDYASPQQALIAVTTDVTWTCPIRRLARSAADHQTEPVYRYHFSWHAPGAGGTAIGATHGLELAFVFRSFAAFSYTPSASDLALADAIEGYWGRFAATGDPAGTPPWPRYDSASDPYLELDTTVTTGTGLESEKCDALDALVD